MCHFLFKGGANVSEHKIYGRRMGDIMVSGLTPEMITNLTDSQKINIQIIQNLTSISTALNDIRHDVSVHDKLLVTGNGEPSLQERVRSLEKFVETILYWSRFVGGAIIVQTLAFFIGIIVALVRFLPVLERLATQP